MKKIILFLTAILLVNCNAVNEIKPKSNAPEFKISKKAFETSLKEEIPFTEMSVGIYMSTKNLQEEKGVSLTFNLDNVLSISDSLFVSYADKISKKVKEELLHLKDYDSAVIKFQTIENNGELRKTNSIQIHKKLQ